MGISVRYAVIASAVSWVMIPCATRSDRLRRLAAGSPARAVMDGAVGTVSANAALAQPVVRHRQANRAMIFFVFMGIPPWMILRGLGMDVPSERLIGRFPW